MPESCFVSSDEEISEPASVLSVLSGTAVSSCFALSEDDSASSQFFIVQSDSTYLDGQYAGFGTVTSGMDIVDKICKDTPVTDSNGTVEKENQPVIEKITVKD